MTAATLDGRVFEPAPLRPPWLRPLVIAMVVALHAAALSIVYLTPKPVARPREVMVDIEPEAAPAESPAPPAEEPKQTEKSTPEPPPPPPQDVQPAPVEPPTAPPPPVVEQPALPPAPQLPVAEQAAPEEQPPLPPVEAPPPPPPAPVELAPPKPPPPPRRVETRPKPEPVRQRPETAERKPAPEPRRTTASRETGRPETSPSRSAPASAASQSAYISEISGAIRSRLFYPAAARARGARGVVGVAFTIGPSGAVTSFAITRSSGYSDLDAAARTLVHSVRFPPPPGGSTHIATSFNYEPR